MLIEVLVAAVATIVMMIIGLRIETERSAIRARQVSERTDFEQRRLDVLLRGGNPDDLGTLSSFKPNQSSPTSEPPATSPSLPSC